MEQTTNYRLKKPGYSDPVDVKDLNDNMDAIDELLKTLSACPHEVGEYIFIKNADFNPNTKWTGTTWQKLPEGQILLAAGDTYKAGQQYGENTHTLTTGEMPSHTHVETSSVHGYSGWTSQKTTSYGVSVYYGSSGSTGNYHAPNETLNMARTSAYASTYSTGGGGAHNIMQLSTAVYIWERTA